MRVFTAGHGTAEPDALTTRLRAAGIEVVVDVRAYPASRRHPTMAREAMEEWLPAAGLAYRWEPRLGGRRRDPPDSPDTALRVRQFAGYAAHMRTAEFAAALDDLTTAGRATTILCAESLWWRCHRRLVADALVLLRGHDVVHVMPDGRTAAHRPTEVVRVAEDDLLVYDAGQARLGE